MTLFGLDFVLCFVFLFVFCFVCGGTLVAGTRLTLEKGIVSGHNKYGILNKIQNFDMNRHLSAARRKARHNNNNNEVDYYAESRAQLQSLQQMSRFHGRRHIVIEALSHQYQLRNEYFSRKADYYARKEEAEKKGEEFNEEFEEEDWHWNDGELIVKETREMNNWRPSVDILLAATWIVSKPLPTYEQPKYRYQGDEAKEVCLFKMHFKPIVGFSFVVHVKYITKSYFYYRCLEVILIY